MTKVAKLKLRGTEQSIVTTSLTDWELFNHVDLAFPDLCGPLAELVKRFGKISQDGGDDDIFPADANCPACGTHIDIVLE